MMPFRNAIEYWNIDGRINSSDDDGTPSINLVGLWPVTPEYMRLNCIQQA